MLELSVAGLGSVVGTASLNKNENILFLCNITRYNIYDIRKRRTFTLFK